MFTPSCVTLDGASCTEKCAAKQRSKYTARCYTSHLDRGESRQNEWDEFTYTHTHTQSSLSAEWSVWPSCFSVSTQVFLRSCFRVGKHSSSSFGYHEVLSP